MRRMLATSASDESNRLRISLSDVNCHLTLTWLNSMTTGEISAKNRPGSPLRRQALSDHDGRRRNVRARIRQRLYECFSRRIRAKDHKERPLRRGQPVRFLIFPRTVDQRSIRVELHIGVIAPDDVAIERTGDGVGVNCVEHP